jgi:hypothetical protein
MRKSETKKERAGGQRETRTEVETQLEREGRAGPSLIAI